MLSESHPLGVGMATAARFRRGDPRDPKTSKITIDGIEERVPAGSFTVQRLSGKWSGSEGDRTLHGTIELRIRGIGGERTLRNRFGAHAVSWG